MDGGCQSAERKLDAISIAYVSKRNDRDVYRLW